ncbi:shikimate dehydrogenase [Ornithinibacillus scapharcae]|uniref:shikimate dehydrogenase n=1 Tax=Ornithinibacillus scapharcae TaxID=1147159 RepID=UPI000225B7D0|nr:shikimate dehydrogenase [Ornithinibacillus scapharcae]
MKYRLGLIGHPIKHSLSPWIHARFLEKSKIEGTYSIFDLREHELKKQIDAFRDEGIRGFNVTIPYKQKIIPLLDGVDRMAREIGAVNTVANMNGKLIGFNTDGIGYLKSLEQAFPETLMNREISILIIGAGGAARGIYYILNQFGFSSIDIANRTYQNAQSIAALNTRKNTTNILSLEDASTMSGAYDLIIQTTNVGMRPNEAASPIRTSSINKSTIVSDIIYQPIWTKLLQEAAENGARVHHGHTMLLYQAKFAFEKWFGHSPSLEDMDRQLKQLLEG